MHEYLPLLIVGATVGIFAAVFILAYALMKNKKEAIGFDRKMKDSEIIRRLLADGGTNVYTIEKNGVRKMIYQTAWRVDGVVGGLAEISMEIPAEMPHYIRN